MFLVGEKLGKKIFFKIEAIRKEPKPQPDLFLLNEEEKGVR